MDTEPDGTRSGMVLVLGLGFLNWLLNDDEPGTEDQITYGESASANYRAGSEDDEQAHEQASDAGAGVRFGQTEETDSSPTPEQRHIDESSGATDPSTETGATGSEHRQSAETPTMTDTDRGVDNRQSTEHAKTGAREATDTAADTDGQQPRQESTEVTAAELNDRIGEIEAEIDRLSQTVETLDRDFDALQSSLGTIETDLEQLIAQAQSTVTEQLRTDGSAAGGSASSGATESTATSPSQSGKSASEPVDRRSEPADESDVVSVADRQSEAAVDDAVTFGTGHSTEAEDVGQNDRTAQQTSQESSRRQPRAGDQPRDTLGDGGADAEVSIDQTAGAAAESRSDPTEQHESGKKAPRKKTDQFEEQHGAATGWPPESAGDDTGSDHDEPTAVSSTISDVTSKVSEQMGEIVDGEDTTSTLAEPTATVVGSEEHSGDPLGEAGGRFEDSEDSETDVEDIDQLLESEDWAVDFDDIDAEEMELSDITGEESETAVTEPTVDEAPAGKPQDRSTEPNTGAGSAPTDSQASARTGSESATRSETAPADGQTGGEPADPAQLAESASPAEAVRTYVEEGNPEPSSVEPESAAGSFEFGKVLLPGDDEPELPELVGADVEKPYLEALPRGYATDSLAIEWMGWLVNEGDPASAVDLVLYYEEAGWLGEQATDDLLAYLEGLADLGDTPSTGTLETYDLETHLHGLEYIKEISEDPSLSEVTTDGV